MGYSILNGEIHVFGEHLFSIKQTLECGQVFRFTKYGEVYKLFAGKQNCGLLCEESRVIIKSTAPAYFVNYFDLERDYTQIKSALSAYPNIKEAVEFGSGIRILNQDIEETIYSFIISANNNIPKIKRTIEAICEGIGERTEAGFAFPSTKVIASQDISFFKKAGAGYRAEYIVNTAKAIESGFSLDISGMSTESARKHFTKLSGVGNKVADCILLFAYRRTDCFPTDIWIERVYCGMFGENNLSREAKSAKLTQLFGSHSGYAQQYLFYFAREARKNKI
ncbi:MAG: 8-oxoguanine DNA glycosylase [Firmicutes bacterium]|nr:8-oxoguanine DNA glycosylase [Bacillota bacterium]